MDEGLLFLFIGFVVVWLILFIYMFILNMRARRIAKETMSLKEYLDKQGIGRKEGEGKQG